MCPGMSITEGNEKKKTEAVLKPHTWHVYIFVCMRASMCAYVEILFIYL